MIGQLKQAYSSVYLSKRFFIGLSVLVLCFALAYLFPWVMMLAYALSGLFVLIVLVEFSFLFGTGDVQATRVLREKLSNGDLNLIEIEIKSNFTFAVNVEVYDELPPEWQVRDFEKHLLLPAKSQQKIDYTYRPTRRGAFFFGQVILLTSFGFQLILRRFKSAQEQEIAVYPSYLSMLKYEYLAISNQLTDMGIKKIRRIGQQSEFEKIKEYVAGDDFRTINWKATARPDSGNFSRRSVFENTV